MKTYFFNESGDLIGEGQAQLDPLESKKAKTKIYLKPPQSTFIAPPEKVPEGMKACFNGKAWELKEVILPAIEVEEPLPESDTPEISPEEKEKMERHLQKMIACRDRIKEQRNKMDPKKEALLCDLIDFVIGFPNE